MIYKEYKNESYNLYTIKTNKFKTCHMEIIFYDKLDKDRITSTNFLVDMLSYSNKLYPTKKLVQEKLEDLYSATFYGVSSRIGNISCLNFIYNFIDPKYTDRSYLKEVIKFPFEMIYNPNIDNHEFDLRIFKIIKSRIKADIDSLKESPMRYTIKKALQYMDPNHPASYPYVGTHKDLDRITPSKLAEEYDRLINEYKCDIYIAGNLDMDKINFMINEYFRNNIIQNKELDIFIPPLKINRIKEKVEHDSFKQSTLVCLLNTYDLTEYEKNYVINIYNHIFGGSSLNSYLASNIREKASLCYNISSIYQKFDNMMIITSGINAKNKDKCVKLIKKCLKDMLNKINQDDIDNAIKSIVNSSKIALDDISSLVDNYFFHNLVNTPLLENRIEKYQDVTLKEVKEIGKKIKLSTIYMMEGDNNEGN